MQKVLQVWLRAIIITDTSLILLSAVGTKFYLFAGFFFKFYLFPPRKTLLCTYHDFKARNISYFSYFSLGNVAQSMFVPFFPLQRCLCLKLPVSILGEHFNRKFVTWLQSFEPDDQLVNIKLTLICVCISVHISQCLSKRKKNFESLANKIFLRT